jgi:hypothetical protein
MRLPLPASKIHPISEIRGFRRVMRAPGEPIIQDDGYKLACCQRRTTDFFPDPPKWPNPVPFRQEDDNAEGVDGTGLKAITFGLVGIRPLLSREDNRVALFPKELSHTARALLCGSPGRARNRVINQEDVSSIVCLAHAGPSSTPEENVPVEYTSRCLRCATSQGETRLTRRASGVGYLSSKFQSRAAAAA